MAKIQTNRITNANVYLNGANFLGRASKVTPPVIKQMMADHKALGMGATVELPTNVLDKMEASFEWNSFYQEVWTQVADTRTAVQLQVRVSLDNYGNGGLTGQTALVLSLGGIFKELPFGDLAMGDPTKQEMKMAVYYYKVTVDGVDVVEIDAMNNLYKVSSQDLLATLRDIIGG